MLQTLFIIPSELFGVPVFGVGWLLGVWAIISLGTSVWLARRQGFNADTLTHLLVAVVVAVAIVFLGPGMLEGANGEKGLPVRGFGVMLLVAVVAGMWLAVHRARQMRLDPEVIFSLALWLFIPGIVGARLFYVIEYWQEFQQPTLSGTLRELANVTKGGLVVYGSVIAAFVSFLFFVKKYKLPALALADLIAPSLVLGQAIGRLGCFLNGCCYGGACDAPWSVTFPPKSPPYERQILEGQFYGIRVAGERAAPPLIAAVAPGSSAAKGGLKPGDRIRSVDGFPVARLEDAEGALVTAARAGLPITIKTAGDAVAVTLPLVAPPARSLPIHPTQLYSALDGFLICLFLLAQYPFRRRDGETIAWLLTLYPITRFMMEIIRTDEPGMFGTGLSISQLISLGVLAGALALWGYLLSRPKGRSGFPA